MAYIILPHRWRRQPTGPVQIDEDYIQGLSWVVNGNSRWPVLGGSVAVPTTRDFRRTNWGTGFHYNYDAVGGDNPGVPVGTASTDTVTVFSVVVLQSARAWAGSIYNRNGWNGQTFGSDGLSYHYVWDGGEWAYSTGLTLSVGTLVACAHSVTPSTVVCAVSGRTNTRTGLSNAARSWSTGAAWLGQDPVDTNRTLDGRILLAGLVYGRAWSESMLREWSQNPWQLFRPLVRRIYVPSAGAPAGDITGTSAVTFTTAGVLKGKGALAGTSALAFGAGSTAIRGKGTLTATSAASFTVAGAIKGKGALAGTSPAAFTVAGAVKGKGALAGTSPAAVNAAGILLGKGALAGTSAAAFTVEGDLTEVLGDGGVAGTSAMAFAASGALTGKGALAGTTASAFTAAATAAGKGALTGQADVLFDVAGVLGSVAAGSVAGSSAITFTPTGTLTGKGALAGTSAMLFGGTGIFPALEAPAGGGAGWPVWEEDEPRPRTKSTIERTREILEEVDEEMREAVTGTPLSEVLARPLDAAAIANMITPKPERRSRPPDDDDDDDLLLLSF